MTATGWPLFFCNLSLSWAGHRARPASPAPSLQHAILIG
jgi:hypothetical protein